MTYKNLQYDLPVFVRSRHYPIVWKGKTYKYNSHFPWKELNVPDNTIEVMYHTNKVYHNQELEKETKVGDRLAEMDKETLKTFVNRLNQFLKDRCTTKGEFEDKRVKASTIEDKQRGLIRSWTNRNNWALEDYYKIRDDLLDN